MLGAAVAGTGFPARLAAKAPLAVRVTVVGAEVRPPLLRTLRMLRGRRSPVPGRRVYFCSDAGGGRNSEAASAAEEAETVGGEEGEGEKASSAVVPTTPRPEDCLTVIALPLPHRPLFPGFYMPIYVKDPKLLQALVENRKRSIPYAGAFLVKNEEDADPNIVTSSKKSIHDLKGKELLRRLHEVGTLAQITSIQGDQVVLFGHRRLHITEMVKDDPHYS